MTAAEQAAPRRPVLKVTGLQVWYGTAQAIAGVTLDVHEGEIVGVLGRNGAGKTSTMLGIMGCGVRRRGTVECAGIDVSALPVHRLARTGIGWVPDARRMFPTLTVAENLGVARSAQRRASHLSDAELVDIFPLLGPLMKRTAGVLSGGEQQVVSIARSMVPRPRVLLVDEPTEGLAPVIVDSLVDTFKVMQSSLGQSILIAEANQQVIAELARRVVLLSVGQQVYAASIEQFTADTSIQQRYLSISRD
jgi:ABC-type branched-subunit amino acid transport system ATPase component